MTELWDLLDENRKPLSRTHKRSERLAAGEYHLVVAVWTFNEAGEFLVTKRAPEKDWPNSWENTAGSALAGETSLQAAARELREETGIIVEEASLRHFATIKGTNDFTDMYFAHAPSSAPVTLQPGETVDYKWATLAEFEAMIERGEVCEPVARRYAAFRGEIRGAAAVKAE